MIPIVLLDESTSMTLCQPFGWVDGNVIYCRGQDGSVIRRGGDGSTTPVLAAGSIPDRTTWTRVVGARRYHSQLLVANPGDEDVRVVDLARSRRTWSFRPDGPIEAVVAADGCAATLSLGREVTIWRRDGTRSGLGTVPFSHLVTIRDCDGVVVGSEWPTAYLVTRGATETLPAGDWVHDGPCSARLDLDAEAVETTCGARRSVTSLPDYAWHVDLSLLDSFRSGRSGSILVQAEPGVTFGATGREPGDWVEIRYAPGLEVPMDIVSMGGRTCVVWQLNDGEANDGTRVTCVGGER